MVAKQRWAYRGRTPSAEQVLELKRRPGEASVARELGISGETVY